MSGNGGDSIIDTPYPFAPFGWITGGTPAIPEFYWNVVSTEQRWKWLCINLQALCDYANQLNTNIGITSDDVAQLQTDFENLKDGEFWETYEKQVTEWINANMPTYVETAIKMVYFGLTQDGYFVAYIPDSWADIQFDTGQVYGRSDYGRLILRMQVDGSTGDANTYSYTLANNTSLEQLIADLEVTAKRGDKSYDALFTNVSETLNDNGTEA